MKQNDRKILIRGLILFAILIAIFYLLNETCRVSVRNERYSIINQMGYLPEDSIDILIVGNSHAQEGINSLLMSDILDKKVLNFSFSQQQTATAYYFLKENFKVQSPDLVVLEAYTLIQQVQGGYEFIPLNLKKIEHYIMLEEERDFIASFFPIAKNHNFWANEMPFAPLIENITSGKDEIPPFFSAQIMSEMAVDRHKTYNSQEFAKEIFTYRLEHILKIKELCEENDAELVITMLPLLDTLVERIDYDALYYDIINDFCEENTIPYFDMNKESSDSWSYKYFREQDYTQNTHLNSFGQTKASHELAYYIADSFNYLSVSEYESPEVSINGFLSSLDKNHNILIVDDCPKNINPFVNPNLKETLEDLGLKLRPKKINTKKENGEPEIYYVSSGAAVLGFTLPSDFYYEKNGVNIFELDKNGSIVRWAVARWDEFDTVLIR